VAGGDEGVADTAAVFAGNEDFRFTALTFLLDSLTAGDQPD
jgi:hypothetical protein